MKIINIKKYCKNYKAIYNADFWNKFIGDKEFCIEFLNKTFSYKRQQYFLLIDEMYNNIEAILVYEKIPKKSIYKIILLAKHKNCIIKGVGKKFIRFLKQNIPRSILILIDDSGIPNYYEKLGFTLCNNLIKKLLEPTNKNCYYKVI